MNCTICWKCSEDILTTISVSGLLNISGSRYSQIVRNTTQSAGNQRRIICSQVGTSETTRAATKPHTNQFCEWLAGIIDGDGSLLVSKQGYTSLEITMGLEDLALLRFIQDKLGGSIKMRSGAKAYRYRLHHREGMKTLIHCINGNIRHSSRLLQLHRVCQQLNIPVLEPVILNNSSHWFAGFFDADGTINYNTNTNQLSVRVCNKLLQDVQYYKQVFGGYIYFDSSQNGYYQWSLQNREDILKMTYYFKGKCRSHKSKRFFLVDLYYSLRDLRAFNAESIHHKAFKSFLKKWQKLKI